RHLVDARVRGALERDGLFACRHGARLAYRCDGREADRRDWLAIARMTTPESSPSPTPTSGGDVTELLVQWSNGDEAALDRLMPLVYEECRRIATRQMRGEREEHTLT